MWMIVAAVVVGLAMVGGILQAVSGSGEKPAARGTAEPSSTPLAVIAIPKPDAQQTEDLLYGLRQIDKELDRARSIDRARNTCSDLLQGEERNKVVEKTRLRFDGVADIDVADAEAIVKLIEQGGWCRS
ncbi:hypothetical protein IMZ11_33740 [Microtetraspora sp. AC03309]|uniref:hypothetical protein n=1 Tax=Microtetraspora sp. AC03309 TaxID=2779376 RepID=UPI001E2D8AAA|nr:hypothetical protein [Microtetraspora sp. AC03309]MCC5580592.1 hypothetical protein [Microtetraspora sp. AC03309]